MEAILDKKRKALKKQKNFLKKLKVNATVEEHRADCVRTISYNGVITYSDWTKNPKS